VFYHARIELKAKRAKEPNKVAREFDVTREDLLEKIVAPFVEGRKFYCGGVVIQPTEVEKLKFSETDRNSTESAPMILARRRASGVLTSKPGQWEMIREGRDVTRELLDEINSRSDLLSAPKLDGAVMREKSNRVFIVHGHDQNAVDHTEVSLHRFGLKPVILREAASKGKNGNREV